MRRVCSYVALAVIAGLAGFGLDEWRHVSDYPTPHAHGAAMPRQSEIRRTHGVQDLVICCMDYRFRELIAQWIQEEFSQGADLVAWPGVSAALTAPEMREQMCDTIALAQELHGVTCVHLVNHRDCGGHGGSGRHTDVAHERRYHRQDLEQAAAVIAERCPGITVRIYFADFTAVEELASEPAAMPAR